MHQPDTEQQPEHQHPEHPAVLPGLHAMLAEHTTTAWQARAQRAEAARDAILQIVSGWCIEYNERGGVDAGDLAWNLQQAGYSLPEEEDGETADEIESAQGGDKRWRPYAYADLALRHALDGHPVLAARTIEEISEWDGAHGIRVATAAWCDAAIAALMEDWRTGTEGAADGVPPDVRWAGRLIAARAASDEETVAALITALPDDPDGAGRYVGRLLSMAALMIRAAG